MSQSPYSEAVLAQHFQTLSISNITYITSGGQKAVYKALDPNGQTIALKVLPPTDPERFAREVAAVQGLPSAHVPIIYSHGNLPDPYIGHHWFTESWINGESLRDKLQHGPLNDYEIIKLGVDMLTVLQVAEKHGIVHRDIKPDNIMFDHDTQNFRLVDFGIARHLEKTTLTAIGMPCTFGYAPIEQLNALKDQIDTRSDLFALGVTMYECSEGVNPFIEGATNEAEVKNRVEKTPLPAIQRDFGVKKGLKDLILAMTRTQRAHRINNAADALDWMSDIANAEAN